MYTVGVSLMKAQAMKTAQTKCDSYMNGRF